MPDPVTAPPRGQGERLLDRDQEVRSLEQAIDDALHGDGRIAIVEGPPGIGKSRLLAEARASAAGRARVLTARGGELEREFPFGIVRQLYEPLLVVPEARERLLDGPASACTPVFDPLGLAMGDDAGDASFGVLHGLYWLTAGVAAEQPLMLVIDDLHWADRASLRFVAWLARRLQGRAVLVVAGLRPAERESELTLLGEIAADPDALLIRPGHLSREATRELVHERLTAEADEDFAAACHDSTGGNPLLLRELLRSLAAEGIAPTAANAYLVREVGPRAISRTVLMRLARLPEDARTVAHAAAVLGDPADVRTIAALADLPEARTSEAIGALTRAEILRGEPPLGFVHPLIRDAVYLDLPPGERELKHSRAAGILRAAGAPAEQVAAHLMTAPPRGDAAVAWALREAAAGARRSGAPESAVAYLRRALDEPPAEEVRGQVLFELGAAEELVNGPAAIEHLIAAYQTLDDPRARARAARSVVRTLLFVAPPEATVAAARQALAELPNDLVDDRKTLEAYELVALYWGGGTPSELKRLEQYREGDLGPRFGDKALTAITTFHWAMTGGPRDRCIELALEALEAGTLFAEDDGVLADNGVLALYALDTLLIADYQPALGFLESAYAKSVARGSLLVTIGMTLWRGLALLLRGDVPQAAALLKEAREMHRLWSGRDMHASYMAAFLIDALREQGDMEGALEVAHASGADPGTGDGSSLWRHARTQLLLAEGRLDEALAMAQEFAGMVNENDNPAARPWRSLLASVYHRMGREEEAVKLAGEELELARRWGAPMFLGRSLRILGTLEANDGIAHLREAAEVLAGTTARLEEAKTLAALGAALRRTGEPTEARSVLRRALELADGCGAQGLAKDVETELHATGARPRVKALAGVDALTASERRVAGLAADGATNRDIAQQLYVTPKTVEVHLSNAYRKLGIRSRRELAGVLDSAQ